MIRKFTAILFFFGLIYLLWPGPSSINDIPMIPNSLKSDEPGDTIQNKNIAAYFARQQRDSITAFYYDQFSYLIIFGLKIPAIKFNHPVENAKTRVRDQVQTTYLEEYTYPLRDSIYVNGFDKVIWNNLNHIPTDDLNKNIIINEESFSSKTTLHYYGSSIIWRLIVYFGIWVLSLALIKNFRRAFKKY